MLRNKSGIFRIVGFLFIVGIILFVSAKSTPEVNNVVTFATALIGFGIILFQLYRDHKIKRAEFIYQLNDTFNDDDDIKDIYMKLKLDRDEKYDFTPEDGRKMGNYVMFFIIMQHLLEDRLIDMKMIDAIFWNKFFIFCNNKASYDYQLVCTKINYPILKLYETWYNYRVSNNLDIYYKEFNLSDREDLFKEIDGKIKLQEGLK